MSPARPEPAGLKRDIGLFGATALGIGAIIGSGIFVVTGIVADIAGPAMIIFSPYCRDHRPFLRIERCRN